MKPPICIHKYLNFCQTNSLPPGLADFLRGTIALYNFSKKYNYDLLIDDSHPLFQYLEPHTQLISNNPFSETIEIIPPQSYDEIYFKVEQLFQKKESFCILTNSFYTFENGHLVNFGPITDECRSFLQEILTPSIAIEMNMQHIFGNIFKFDKKEGYKTIHLRCGDSFLHDNIYDNNLYEMYYHKINNLLTQHPNEKYVLLSDSTAIATKLKQDIPALYYWNNSKTHLGSLNNSNSSSILDTLIDFFIMSQSNEIISYPPSGFSIVCSLIYNIRYTLI